jgi:CrcB protein
MWFKILLLIIGGAVGTVCRFLVSSIVHSRLGDSFSWGTLIVNLLGCLLIGFLWSLSAEKSILSPSTKLFLMVGFLGAFTTFSTYALESINFLREQEILLMVGNIFLNNVVGLVMIIVGIWCARLL